LLTDVRSANDASGSSIRNLPVTFQLTYVIARARGNRGAGWALVAQFGLGMLKGANRATLAKAQLPEQKSWFDRYGWTHTFWVPLITWVWLFVLVGSAFAKRDFKTVRAGN